MTSPDPKPEPKLVTFGCRMNTYESEVMRDHARAAGLDPAQMALAFTLRQPFLASSIVGATSLEQLETNLGAADLTLSDDLMAAIEAIHARDPDPAP